MNDEYKTILEQKDMWQDFGNMFGWTLLGWTDNWCASFAVNKHETVEISKSVYDSIEKYINENIGGGWYE